MVRSRLGLKALGLCALVLGLMAFASSAAQAEPTAFWKIVNNGTLFKIPNGPEGVGNLNPQLEIKEFESGTATLLFTTIGGTKVGILCKKAEFSGGGQLLAEGTISLGRVLFKECVTTLNGSISPPCKPKTKTTASGELLSEKGKGLIQLDEVSAEVKEDYVKIKPETEAGAESKLFATIELGEECSIGSSVKVEAKSLGEGLWIKDCAAEGKTSKERFLEERAEHLIEEALHGLIALGQPATIDGSAIVRLAGAHAGLAWGGTPG